MCCCCGAHLKSISNSIYRERERDKRGEDRVKKEMKGNYARQAAILAPRDSEKIAEAPQRGQQQNTNTTTTGQQQQRRRRRRGANALSLSLSCETTNGATYIYIFNVCVFPSCPPQRLLYIYGPNLLFFSFLYFCCI